MKGNYPTVALLAASMMLWGAQSVAGPITETYNENVFGFNYVVNSGVFAGTEAHTLSQGVDWDVDISITEIDNNISPDLLNITGTAQHINAPHGEGLGQIFSFDFIIDTASLTAGIVNTLPSIDLTLDHDGHDNVFSASLEIDLSAASHIDGYSLVVSGVHAVPVPATAMLLALGLVGMSRRRV